MNRENNSTEKEMIVAEDITDIKLTRAGYYWEMGFNEFDFTCKIKGEDDTLHMREQRHDEGNCFTLYFFAHRTYPPYFPCAIFS